MCFASCRGGTKNSNVHNKKIPTSHKLLALFLVFALILHVLYFLLFYFVIFLFSIFSISIFSFFQKPAICAMVQMAMIHGADFILAFKRPKKTKTTSTEIGEMSHTRIWTDLLSLSSRKESSGASEPHAAKTSLFRAQLRSGNVVSIVLWPQSADDDDTCFNVHVGLWPKDVLTSVPQESQKSPEQPTRRQDSPVEQRGAQESHIYSRHRSVMCVMVRMANFSVKLSQTCHSVLLHRWSCHCNIVTKRTICAMLRICSFVFVFPFFMCFYHVS